MEFPEALEAQLVLLEEKEKISLSSKALSHGHLNKLTKLKAQTAAQAQKIATLDHGVGRRLCRTRWEKIKHPSELYQQCRGEMLELYNTRLEEMRQMKHDLNLASRSLLDQQLEEPPIPETINVDEQMSVLKEPMANFGNSGGCGRVDGEEDVVEIPGSQEEETATGSRDAKTATKAAFRGAASPQKVAQLHLKTKKDKDKVEK